MQLIHSCT